MGNGFDLERIVRGVSGDLTKDRLSTPVDFRFYRTEDGSRVLGWWLLSSGGVRVELLALDSVGVVTARTMGDVASAILSPASLSVALEYLAEYAAI
jgi:hypothetical protein